MKPVWTMAAAAAALVGCAPDLPGPRLTGVSPELVWNGEPSTIILSGANFYPEVQQDAGQRGKATINNNFKAFLIDDLGVEQKLTNVEVINYTRISAIVPKDLLQGFYDLRVIGPMGNSTLDDEFFISESQADHIRVQTASGLLDWEVNEQVVLDIDLLDRNEDLVFKDPEFFPVRLTVLDGAGQPPVLSQLTTTLENELFLQDGTITGSLRRGHGIVSLVSQLAQQVTVTVEADDRSNVAVGEEDIIFRAAESHLEIRLPSQDFSTVAGQPFDVELEFVDDFGNPDLTPHDVALRGTCSNFSVPLNIAGATTVTLTEVNRISGTVSCPDEILTFQDTQSDPFEVLAAAIDHFDVQVAPDPIAGEEMDVQLNARDAYGNPLQWLGVNQEFTFQDSVGGTGLHDCVAQPFNVGEFRCTVEAFVASPAIYLHVDGDDGTPGDSQVAYTVHPNPSPDTVTVTILGTPVAGASFDVDVFVYDKWANLIDASIFAGANFLISDELGEILCEENGFGLDFSADFVCELVTARPNAVLTVLLQIEGVQGDSAPTQVDNGELYSVVVEAFGPFQATDVIAGETIFLDFTGEDEFGNRYIVQTDPTLDITDTTGTLSETVAVLGLDGSVQVQANVTIAGDTQITASQFSEPLGTSPIVTILPADHASLQVTVSEPWAYQDTPTEIRVESVDAFGNRTDWSGTTTVVSRSTATAPLDITMTNGVGADSYTWDDVAVNDVVDATTQTPLAGESSPLHVVRSCPLTGPTAAVQFGGFDDAVVCYDPIAEEGVFSASFATSVAGGAPLISYAMAADGTAVNSAADYLIFSVDEIGAHPLRALVVQSNGCADEIPAVAWVGLDDGLPVGPIPMTSVDASIEVAIGVTTVDIIGVTDCSRDPAASVPVKVRTTKGEITGISNSGFGLEATLDVNGDASFTLSANAVTTGGTAELHAWVESAASLGRLDVDVEGDNERPEVWAQDPTGETLALVPEIRLTFSEPMLISQMVPANFDITGPVGAVVDQVTLENNNTEAVVTLVADADGALGTWSVTATDNLRDASGNRLDGQWAGTRSDYIGTFGAVSAPGDSVACSPVIPDGGVFRPDGDDGLEAESDIVLVDLTTAVAPAWWIFSVTNQATGALIRRNYLVPGGAVDTVSWDGLDASGQVVENGSYEVRIEPDDGLGNQGTGCSVVATVDNNLGDVQ